MNGKRVAIIGSGVSGLVSIKTCIEEGLQPVCFERDDHLGGLWVYSEEVGSEPTGTAGIYKGLITNVSKEMMAFSDFPFSRNIPPYLRSDDVMQYLQKYVETFDLSRHIQFNTTVIEVTKCPDFQETGRWIVRTKHKDKHIKTEIFDGVMVCTGMYSSGFMPNYPGQSEFKGQILHGSQFKRGEQFKEKTIVVIGASHSAGDIAILSCDHAKKVYISLRNGAWIIPRITAGQPTDTYVNQRWKTRIPSRLFRYLAKRKLMAVQDWKTLGLQSIKHPLNSAIMVNDVLPMRIMSGKVHVRSGLRRFDESRVIFDDDSYLDGVDCVVFATGYNQNTSFLKDDILSGGSHPLELYLHVMPPALAHPTLAAIGYVRSSGALGPTAELQSRYAAKVFKREVKLPSRPEMLADVKKRMDATIQQYGVNEPKINPTTYHDELAKAIGILPTSWDLLLDLKLAYHFYFSPAYPACFRLKGQNATSDARERLLRSEDDLVHGITLKTVRPGALKRVEDMEKNKTVFIMLVVLCFLGFVLAVAI